MMQFDPRTHKCVAPSIFLKTLNVDLVRGTWGRERETNFLHFGVIRFVWKNAASPWRKLCVLHAWAKTNFTDYFIEDT